LREFIIIYLCLIVLFKYFLLIKCFKLFLMKINTFLKELLLKK
jgi:hypothetical protein